MAYHEYMIGVDEVGRGAWAGPLLVVAARAKLHLELPEGLTDSKMLTQKQKEQFYEQLLIVCDFGEGWVEVEEINELGLAACLRIGVGRALTNLGAESDEEICIDGKVNMADDSYTQAYARVGADISEPVVSAASVYAKVKRDKYMWKLHYRMPNYGFKENVGYGTTKHIEALKKFGVTNQHRKTFKPIMELL